MAKNGEKRKKRIAIPDCHGLARSILMGHDFFGKIRPMPESAHTVGVSRAGPLFVSCIDVHKRAEIVHNHAIAEENEIGLFAREGRKSPEKARYGPNRENSLFPKAACRGHFFFIREGKSFL